MNHIKPSALRAPHRSIRYTALAPNGLRYSIYRGVRHWWAVGAEHTIAVDYLQARTLAQLDALIGARA